MSSQSTNKTMLNVIESCAIGIVLVLVFARGVLDSSFLPANRPMPHFHDTEKETLAQLQAVCRDTNRKSEVLDALEKTGKFYQENGLYSVGENYFAQVAARLDQLTPAERARKMCMIGAFYRDWGKSAKAAALYEKALNIDKTLNDERAQTEDLIALAELAFSDARDSSVPSERKAKLKNAASLLDRAMTVAKSLPKNSPQINVINNYAQLVTIEQGDYEKLPSGLLQTQRPSEI